jgi:uncharacterized membrane protein YphA (DoxX/SURF4 family)
MIYDTQIFYTILEWLAGNAVIIDFMTNTINTLYSYGICLAWFSYTRGWGAFFGLERDCQSQMLFISS